MHLEKLNCNERACICLCTDAGYFFLKENAEDTFSTRAVVSTHSAGVVRARSSSLHYWPRNRIQRRPESHLRRRLVLARSPVKEYFILTSYYIVFLLKEIDLVVVLSLAVELPSIPLPIGRSQYSLLCIQNQPTVHVLFFN